MRFLLMLLKSVFFVLLTAAKAKVYLKSYFFIPNNKIIVGVGLRSLIQRTSLDNLYIVGWIERSETQDFKILTISE